MPGAPAFQSRTATIFPMDYLRRQKSLAAELRRSRLPALIVTHLPNIRYLCGFTGSAGVLLVVAGEQAPRLTFFTDGRYTSQAGAEVQGAKVVITRKSAQVDACAAAQRA